MKKLYDLDLITREFPIDFLVRESQQVESSQMDERRRPYWLISTLTYTIYLFKVLLYTILNILISHSQRYKTHPKNSIHEKTHDTLFEWQKQTQPQMMIIMDGCLKLTGTKITTDTLLHWYNDGTKQLNNLMMKLMKF